MKRRRERRAAALDDVYGELPGARRERETQAGRRRFGGGRERTHDKGNGAARLRRDREALQLDVAKPRQPSHERMAASGAQRLLGGPQPVAPTLGAHDHQVHEIDTGGRKRWCIRLVRRGEPHGALAFARKRCKPGQHERELADTLFVSQ